MFRLKYLLVFIVPFTILCSFIFQGLWVFAPVVLVFLIIPLIELLLKPDPINMDKMAADIEKKLPIYDWMLYLVVPVHIGLLIYFLISMQNVSFGTTTYYMSILNLSLSCAALGINVGHELGHRNNRWEQLMGEIMLLSSLNTHFIPYHNGGHHYKVATPEDCSTARKNELVFTFWFRSCIGSYFGSWKLEKERLKNEGKPMWSFGNKMVGYNLANIALLLLIYFAFGLHVLFAFLAAAIIGLLFYETINYIEHYGLLRKKNKYGKYEPVRHIHSWNSDHPVSRMLLFNLSRHSDHHYNGSKKYQILKSYEKSPQMPTGYAGMVVLALIPPLWFWVMNKRLKQLQNT